MWINKSCLSSFIKHLARWVKELCYLKINANCYMEWTIGLDNSIATSMQVKWRPMRKCTVEYNMTGVVNLATNTNWKCGRQSGRNTVSSAFAKLWRHSPHFEGIPPDTCKNLERGNEIPGMKRGGDVLKVKNNIAKKK